MSETTTPPAADETAEEFFESLTGHDEIAIHKAFGAEITELAESRPLGFLRALVFAHKIKAGTKHAEALKQSLDLTLRAVQGYFAEDTEPNPQDPVTESGKDDSANG